MLRVKEGHGIQPYYPAVVTPNGTIKLFYARINGSPVHREDGVYYLRYRDNTGKRHYQFAGADPKLARHGFSPKTIRLTAGFLHCSTVLMVDLYYLPSSLWVQTSSSSISLKRPQHMRSWVS
jgi:hypothetical protein